ncbi:Ig-like domain-containing protein [Enterobacteriaceae bacterium H11S18]|uniref:Ig-like domain-containing protein n=1 Tax=Dryocola clanedunensis TaxID=2925396 RepID=UPI0022F03713|nr:Ig-like domain-containing protein [Dryocola clanedunensis]MCT4708937.1 Ig-like domain-containing protein [Dryocola clanedunensis]
MSESTNNERDAVLAAAASNSNASSPSVGIDYTSIINIDSIVDDTGKYVGTVANGGLTDDLQPTLNGYLPHGKGIEIRVYVNNSVIGYTTVGDDGNWSFTPSTPLEAGRTYHFQVFMLDPGDGNTLLPSTTYTIITTEANQDGNSAPDAPVIDSVVDAVPGGITGALHNGDATNDARPALSGHAEAGTTVNVYDNGVLLGSTAAAADGSWTFTPAAALKDGEHNLTATAVNELGESASTDAFVITVDTVISVPAIVSILDDAGTYTGDVANGGLTDDKQPLLSGTGEPGSSVTITMYGPTTHKNHSIATVQVGEDGTWSYQFVGKQALQSGDNVFHITSTDVAGNSAAGADYTVTLTGANQDNNAVPPDAPVITAGYDAIGPDTGIFSSGTTTDDTAPLLTGTAEANSIVTIYDNGTVIGSAAANGNGNWYFKPSARSEGVHTFTATATDAAGSVSGGSDGFVVNIEVADTTPPDAPVITTVYDDVGTEQGNVTNGGKTDDSHLTISGTAEAGSVVVITHVIDKTGAAYTDGSVVADASGHWTFQMDKGFVEGEYGNRTITATATDAAGNVSEKSADYVVNYVASNMDDTTPPDAPVITAGYDDVGPSQGSFGSGTTTDDTTPQLSGKAEAGSLVKIYDGSALIGSVAAGSNGEWTFTPSARSEGVHIFTATATDAAGNTSVASAGFVVNIDIPEPVAFTVTQVYDNVGSDTGFISVNGNTPVVTDDTTPTVYGTGEPGELVVARSAQPPAGEHTSVNGEAFLLGSAVVDASGHWSITIREMPALKGIAIVFSLDDKHIPAYFDFEPAADTTPPDAPVITTVYDDVGTMQGNVSNGGLTDDGQVKISGTAEANSHVTVTAFAGGKSYLLGDVVTDAGGHWSYQMSGTQNLRNILGTWVFTAKATDAAGNTSGTSDPYSVQVVGSNQDDTTVPDAPTITSGYDNVGASQGSFTSGTTTDDTTPQLSGKAEAGSLVKIYDGSSVIGSTTANSSGSWSFTPSARSEGKHIFTATATDAAGHVSGKSNGFVVTIDIPDTTPPAAPVITTVYDDVGTKQGNVANGGPTDDGQVKISGTAEANSHVTVTAFAGGKSYLLGDVVTDAGGHWSYQMSGTQNLRNILGTWVFTAKATDAAGNTSGTSDPYSVQVVGSNQDDTTVPDAPTITSGYDNVGASQGSFTSGTTTDDTTPQLSGKAEAGSLVKIYDGSSVIGSTTANSSGSWSFTPSARSEGQHIFTATATDAAGHVSGKSNGFAVNIDTFDAAQGSDDFAKGYNYINNVGGTVTRDSGLSVSLIEKGNTNYYAEVSVNQGTMVVRGGGVARLEFGGETQFVQLKAGTDFNGAVIRYYNSHGDQISSAEVSSNTGSNHKTYEYTASGDEHIAYVTIRGADGYFSGLVIDDIQWGDAPSVSLQSALHTELQPAHDDVLPMIMHIDDSHQSAGHADMTDHQQNTLQLTLNDILSEAHDNLFVQDGHKQLAVTGDAGDVVELKVEDLAHNTWQDAGQVTAGGVQYEVYHHTGSDVELLVQHGVELHQVS